MSLIKPAGVSSTVLQANSLIYAEDSGSTDAYVIAISPAISAYVKGQLFYFKANTANTGSATLNICSLGAKSIKKNFNADLETGDILAGQRVSVIYDGTNFQLLSGVDLNAENIKSALGVTTLEGDNTGDEDTSSILSKLGVTSLKTTDLQAVTNTIFYTSSNDYVDVTGLTIPVLANKKYFITAYFDLGLNGGTICYGKFLAPTGCTFKGVYQYSTFELYTEDTLLKDPLINCTSSPKYYVIVSAVLIVGSNAGNLKFQIKSANNDGQVYCNISKITCIGEV